MISADRMKSVVTHEDVLVAAGRRGLLFVMP